MTTERTTDDHAPFEPDATTVTPTPTPATPAARCARSDRDPPGRAAGRAARRGRRRRPGAPVAPVTTAPVVVAPAARRSRSGTWLNILLVGALAVAVGGVAFAVGRHDGAGTAAAAGNGNVVPQRRLRQRHRPERQLRAGRRRRPGRSARASWAAAA